MADLIAQLADKSNDFADFINSIASKSEKNEASRNSDFSNFLNNLNAKAKNIQSSYKENTANNTVKSNTSSINKKALENTGSSAVENNKKTTKEALENPKKVPEDLSSDTNNQALNKSSKEINDNKKETKDNLSPKEIQDVSDNTKKPAETINEKNTIETQNKDNDNKKESSSLNIETNSNNNSPVEPSPVIFLDEQEKTLDTTSKKDCEISIGTVLNTQSQENSQNSILESLKNQDTVEETNKIIQAVEDFLKKDNSLEDNQKEEILKTLDEILNKADSSNTSLAQNEIGFSEILTIDGKKDETVINQQSTDKVETAFNNENDEAVNDIKEIKKDIDFLASDIDSLAENTDETNADASTTAAKISKFIEHIDSMIEKLKSNPHFSEAKIDDLNKVQDILKSIDLKEVETTLNSLKLTLKEGLNSLKEIIDDVFNASNIASIKKDETLNPNSLSSNKVNSNTEVSAKIQTIDSIETNADDFKTQDNKALNDILDILNNDNLELTEKLKEELKAQIEEALEAADDKKTDTIIKTVNNAINQADGKVSVEENSASDTKEAKTALNINTFNNIEANNISNNNSEAKDNGNKEGSFLNKNSTENEADIDIDINSDTNLDKRVSKNTDKIEVESDDTDTKTENAADKKDYKEVITKLTDSLVEDMDLEFNLSDLNLEEGSALSVSDEITKLALSENSSISTIDTVGSVVYDSIGVNKVIKAADFMSFKMDKITQELDNTDFLSKISNKIENLAQNQGQKLTLVLRPHDLGRLSIEMIKTNDGLSANILAQNDTVRNYIEKHIQGLKDQLAQSGVNVNNIQIKTIGSNNTSNYQGNESRHDSLAQNSEQNKNNQNQNQNQNDSYNKKEAKEFLNKITNLDFKFERNFSAVLNKAVNYES